MKITDLEREELSQLMQQYQEGLLRKAQALSEAVKTWLAENHFHHEYTAIFLLKSDNKSRFKRATAVVTTKQINVMFLDRLKIDHIVPCFCRWYPL